MLILRSTRRRSHTWMMCEVIGWTGSVDGQGFPDVEIAREGERMAFERWREADGAHDRKRAEGIGGSCRGRGRRILNLLFGGGRVCVLYALMRRLVI